MRGRYEVLTPRPERREILRRGPFVVRTDDELVERVKVKKLHKRLERAFASFAANIRKIRP